MKRALQKYPLLTKIIALNLVVFLAAMILVTYAFNDSLNTTQQLLINARSDALKSAIAHDQLRWRTQMFAGNTESVMEELAELKKKFKLQNATIVAMPASENFDIVFPSAISHLETPMVFAANLEPIDIWSIISKRFFLFFLMAIGILIFGNLFLGSLILRAIYLPIVKASKNILQQNIESRDYKSSNEVNRIIDQLNENLIATRDFLTYKAIAQTTQSLAHDVRKPFSMLKTGINILQNSANNPSKFRSNLTLLISEVERASQSVDGLIADIMEIGSTSSQLIQEPAAPEALIESTLGEIFRVYPHAKISLSYEFRHTMMAHVHTLKIARVFTNIVGNAIQAMESNGEIWFKTRDIGTDMNPWIEFCIGNSGSFIPVENLGKLFEAFFTSGKKSGTGLGLAIAQKVVAAHGGKIWCHSEQNNAFPKGKVEFFLTLPGTKTTAYNTTAHLPKHSTEITNIIQSSKQAIIGNHSPIDLCDSSVVQEIEQNFIKFGSKVRLLLVDDEAIYRDALTSWIEHSDLLSNLCEVIHAKSSSEAVEKIRSQSSISNFFFDIIITDFDMGPESLNGFELTQALRTKYAFKRLIYVHSNRMMLDDNHRAFADGFLPKPMARGQLLRLILQAIQTKKLESEHNHKSDNLSDEKKTLTPDLIRCLNDHHNEQSHYKQKKLLPEILVVEDDIFMREAWGELLKPEATPILLKDFKTLNAHLGQDPSLPKRLKIAVTDMNLDDETGNGLDVANLLKSHNPNLRVVLCSDGRYRKSDWDGKIDKVIAKDPCSYRDLMLQIERTPC